MQSETALFWWHTGIFTRKRYARLCDAYGDIDNVPFPASREDVQRLGVRQDAIDETLVRIRSFQLERLKEDMFKLNVKLLTIEDEEYPSLLKEAPDAPVFLSYIGYISVLRQPMLGIVGTRGMTGVGRQLVGHFVPVFVRSGVVTVSGLALGVDGEVARRTMEHGGRTVAALGGGLSSIFPAEHRSLASDIVENGGLLLSEFPFVYPAGTYTFPARNRIIAGLSMGTLVIEAPEKSGAIITAELAADYNREVFAVPGAAFSPSFRGCNRLIGTGQAQLVLEPEDVLKTLGIMASNRAESISFMPNEGPESIVYAALTSLPQTMDDLVHACSLTAGDIASALTMMELAGGVKCLGEGQWVRN